MRIFKDLELVEHLGSELARIVDIYGKDSFILRENFMTNIFYLDEHQIGKIIDQANDQAILLFCKEAKSTQEIMAFIGMKHKTYFRNNVLKPIIKSGLLELTVPQKPKSPNQKYKTKAKNNK